MPDPSPAVPALRTLARRQVRTALAYEAIGSGVPSTVAPCQPNRCWIEVQMFDELDQPLAGDPYWIRLPDGEVREGRLDVNGMVRLDDIPCGLCQVRFPDSGDAVLELLGARAPRDKDWIEIMLLDDNGAAVADEPYRVRLPDGEIRTGRLDLNGLARLTDIPTGVCQVEFPDRHGADLRLPE